MGSIALRVGNMSLPCSVYACMVCHPNATFPAPAKQLLTCIIKTTACESGKALACTLSIWN